MFGYPSVFEAADHVPEILEFGPTGLEGIDGRLISDMVQKGRHTSQVPMLPDGDGWLLVEFGGDSREESDDKAKECMERLQAAGKAPAMRLFDDKEEEQQLWAVREAGLGATSYVPGERDHWPGWEDAAVPPERLGEYLRQLSQPPRRTTTTAPRSTGILATAVCTAGSTTT